MYEKHFTLKMKWGCVPLGCYQKVSLFLDHLLTDPSGWDSMLPVEQESCPAFYNFMISFLANALK